MKKIIITSFVLIISQFLHAQGNGVVKESFSPIPGERYVVNAWVQDEVNTQVETYTSQIQIINDWNDGQNSGQEVHTLIPNESSLIIDGWQLIQEVVELHPATTRLEIKLIAGGTGITFFDDIRFFPFNGNLKSFVYDPENQRLLAELDENNYATFYEYDTEGGLVRVKKETERGIVTIQETRSGNSKINN